MWCGQVSRRLITSSSSLSFTNALATCTAYVYAHINTCSQPRCPHKHMFSTAMPISPTNPYTHPSNQTNHTTQASTMARRFLPTHSIMAPRPTGPPHVDPHARLHQQHVPGGMGIPAGKRCCWPALVLQWLPVGCAMHQHYLTHWPGDAAGVSVGGGALWESSLVQVWLCLP